MDSTSHIVNLSAGAIGVAAQDVVTGNTHIDMVLKIIIGVVSVLPSILSLFKKKKEETNG
ncbi:MULTISPECIES: hypothetical protein [Chitinophagaceae]